MIFPVLLDTAPTGNLMRKSVPSQFPGPLWKPKQVSWNKLWGMKPLLPVLSDAILPSGKAREPCSLWCLWLSFCHACSDPVACTACVACSVWATCPPRAWDGGGGERQRESQEQLTETARRYSIKNHYPWEHFYDAHLSFPACCREDREGAVPAGSACLIH